MFSLKKVNFVPIMPTLLYILSFIFLSVHVAVAQESKQGHWTDTDKMLALQELDVMRNDVESYLGEEKTNALFVCLIEKMENSYANYAVSSDDSTTTNKMIQECMVAISSTQKKVEAEADNNSSISNWSIEDKALLDRDLQLVNLEFEEDLGEENFAPFNTCARERLENTFENYATMLSNETKTMEILITCMKEALAISEE